MNEWVIEQAEDSEGKLLVVLPVWDTHLHLVRLD